MKKPNFKAGDKVFAKVKGYPPWPARIIAENGKKYDVKFYGTGETGLIKVEDLFYYIKNKEKFQKPLKRKDYVDAFEQIEEAIKKAGGDGDSSSVDDSVGDISAVSLNSTNDSVNTSIKGVKKSVKRKRSIADNKSPAESTPVPKKKSVRSAPSTEEVSEDVISEESEESPVKKFPTDTKRNVTPDINSPRDTATTKKPPNDTAVKRDMTPDIKSPEETTTKKSLKVKYSRVKKDKEKPTDEDGEKECDVINNEGNKPEEVKGSVKSDDNERIEEKPEDLDFKVAIVSEKILKNNIAYANHVKESGSLYKGCPVEPREDYINQVLPIKLSSDVMGGIKLHMTWPLKFENEYERAIYDEAVATRVLDTKHKLISGDTSIINNRESFIPNIELTAGDIKQYFYLREIDSKRAKIARLKIEADLVGLDSKIKNCLGLDKANPQEAIGYLESMCEIEFDDIMLIKHPHIVEMVRRLRKYVGNTKEWNMSEESLSEFSSEAEKVRSKAENVYTKFKNVVKIPENSTTSFWEGFMELVNQFRTACRDMTENQIYVLCAEPSSRQAFLDHLDEVESEKENSSGAANSEQESSALNGAVGESTCES